MTKDIEIRIKSLEIAQGITLNTVVPNVNLLICNAEAIRRYIVCNTDVSKLRTSEEVASDMINSIMGGFSQASSSVIDSSDVSKPSEKINFEDEEKSEKKKRK